MLLRPTSLGFAFSSRMNSCHTVTVPGIEHDTLFDERLFSECPSADNKFVNNLRKGSMAARS